MLRSSASPLRAVSLAVLLASLSATATAQTSAIRPDTGRRVEIAGPRGRGQIRAVTLIRSPDDSSRSIDESGRWQVRVTLARGAMVLPGVITDQMPKLVGDSVLYGFLDQPAGGGWRAFRFRARTRAVDLLPIPERLTAWPAGRTFTGNGRYLAYVGQDSASKQWCAVVRRVPSGVVIASAGAIDDFFEIGRHAFASWHDDRLWTVDIGLKPEGRFSRGDVPKRYLRVRGSLAARVIRADTVAESER
jgi:hypothetical protein